MTTITLVGAGSAQFGYGILGEIFQSEVIANSNVVLHDINEQALATVTKTARDFCEANSIPCTLSATTNPEVALKGADFVVISIEVGDRFLLWDQDWKIPQQYGIPQVYGENGGPGGLFHSLRIIPPILELCRRISELCPNATVFNYSNPMSRICTTVHKAYPELNFLGMCHEIIRIERNVPIILDTPFEELDTYAAGLNHFNCLLEAKYKKDGSDAYGEIRKKAAEHFRTLPGASDFLTNYLKTGQVIETEGNLEIEGEITKAARDFTEYRLIPFMLERFNLLPITSDSHFGEYLQWGHDVVDHRGILDFYRYYSQTLSTKQPEIKLELHERVVPIIEGILTDSGHREHAVNLPNKGYIAELPEWLAVEVPVTVHASGVKGIPAPPLPVGYAGLLQNQVGIHAATAEAVLERSKEAVIQALLVDPIVPVAANIPELVEVMIQTQEKFLGYLK